MDINVQTGRQPLFLSLFSYNLLSCPDKTHPPSTQREEESFIPHRLPLL